MLKFIFGCVLLTLVIFAIVWAAQQFDPYAFNPGLRKCAEAGDIMGVEYVYSESGVCYVKIDGSFSPMNTR